MNHFMYDGYRGFRSRLDDVNLIYEILEEIPIKLGLKPIMPPFVMPFYNGMVPEDCGISAFVFLTQGHFTVHTFSFREVFFADLLCSESIDTNTLVGLLNNTFPSERHNINIAVRDRHESFPDEMSIDKIEDFGPHLFLDYENFEGPFNLEELFELFDILPSKIGMTPIMRPYAVKNNYEKQNVISVLTMIAESHISLHLFRESRKAYFDLFSCSFFDYKKISTELKKVFRGKLTNEVLIARGSKYKTFRTSTSTEVAKSRQWLKNAYKK